MLVWGTGPLDAAVLDRFYLGGDPAVVPVALDITHLGEPWVIVCMSVAGAIGLLVIGRRRASTELFLLVMGGRLLGYLLKQATLRPRPDLDPHLISVSTSSFPSGHTSSATIFYVGVALILARGTRFQVGWVIAGALVAAAVGWSRVALGVHWPSDVVGGWTFGLAWTIALLALSQYWAERDARAKGGAVTP